MPSIGPLPSICAYLPAQHSSRERSSTLRRQLRLERASSVCVLGLEGGCVRGGDSMRIGVCVCVGAGMEVDVWLRLACAAHACPERDAGRRWSGACRGREGTGKRRRRPVCSGAARSRPSSRTAAARRASSAAHTCSHGHRQQEQVSGGGEEA
eukprot:3525341-Rhodomonas_salina.2